MNKTTARYIASSFLVLLSLCLPSWAAVVSTNGYFNDFSVQPPAADWATLSVAGSASDSYVMDDHVNANLTAAGVTGQLSPGTGDPPSANASAVWSSGNFYIQTRPTGNRYTVLIGKFINQSETNATQITISYQLTLADTSVSEDSGLGTHAYYSLTGEANSWTVIPALENASGTVGTSTKTATLAINWTNGASLYLAWADDNASFMGTDIANQIDNFSLQVTAGTPLSTTVAGILQYPTNQAFIVVGTTTPASVAVYRGTPPYVVQWYLDDTTFGLPDETDPFTADLSQVALGAHRIWAKVSDQGGSGDITYTATNSFTVVAPLVIQLASPASNATFDHTASITGTATPTGGTPPFAVRFYLDEVAVGAPLTTAPYTYDFGTLFVGPHTVQARVTDANGWESTSAINNFTITGPLAILFSPTNGTALNYGQTLVFDPDLGGGTGPYSVTFYTNGQPAGTVTTAPYTLNLGILPVGDYLCYARATDASSPVQQIYSTTNVITVLENPLVVNVTAPTANQQIATNSPFSVTASVTVQAPLTVAKVEFYLDGALLGEDATAPYSMVISNRELGVHTVFAAATDSLGRRVASAANEFTFISDPLANNNFANRMAITFPARVVGSNVGATTEPGEQLGGGFQRRGNTVWFSWVATTSGNIQADTAGSDFNTTLGVFTGTAVNALTQVAFNDNASFNLATSLLTFNAVEGTEYQIQLAGAPGNFGQPAASGNYILNLGKPPGATITSPSNGVVFIAGSNIPVSVTATAAVGTVSQVDIYRNGVLAATDTEAPYELLVQNAPPGSNTLVAVVTDSLGQIASSAAVNVFVANIGMTITSPADGANYYASTGIMVSALATLPEGNMVSAGFYVDDVWFADDTAAPFSAVWTNVTPGMHRLTVVGTDDAGKNYSSTPVYIAVAQQLVPTGSVWKFLDNGSDQGTAWRALEFDDSSWTNGPAELGYGDGDEATIVASGPNNNFYITTYFRHAFNLESTNNIASLYFLVKRDDGCVIYINGVEAARLNITSGTITYTTTASNASDDGTNFWGAVASAGLLREGVNVIAVEMHQSGANSSDMSFDLALYTLPEIVRNKYPTVALTQPAADQRLLVGQSLTLAASAEDSDGAVAKLAFFANSALLYETTNASATFVWTNPPAGLQIITAVATDDQGASKTSEAVHVPVFPMGGSGWRAVNDQQVGMTTHPYATFYTPLGQMPGTGAGAMRNLATGAALPVRLSVSGYLISGQTQNGAPPVGTPAHTLFNGLVDFGSGQGDNAILFYNNGYVTHQFSGLNPSRLYRLRATVVGGVAANANWWTKFALNGATAMVKAHTANVLTHTEQPTALQAHEAAMNTGDNRTGDVVGWDNIVPSANGVIQLVSSRYIGPAPGNNTPGQFAHAPVAIWIEEIGPAPLTWVTAPTEGWTIEGPIQAELEAEALAYDGVARVDFQVNGALVGSDTTSPYTVIWTNAIFGPHTIQSIAYDASGTGTTSAVVNFNITQPPTNVVPPTIASVSPTPGTLSNLTSIRVIFSERVQGLDAADLLINGAPATNLTGSGSSYVFSFPAQPLGPVAVSWASAHGIVDFGWPASLPFDANDASATWNYVVADLAPPTVATRVPAAGASVNNLIQVTVAFNEPVTGVDASDFLVNGTPAYAMQTTGTNYTFLFSQPASGTVNISWATNHGIADLAVVPNDFNRTGSGSTWTYNLDAKTILFPSNSLWLFVKGTNEVSDPTSAWRQLSFDDSSWSNAPAPFFYGDPYSNGVPAYTLLSDMRSNYTSIYLRKPFVVNDVSSISNLTLRAYMDDGMVVWINGVEVLRYNVPSGDLAFDDAASSATQENNGLPYSNRTLLSPVNYLVNGTNVIAIHAFNESLSSSSDFGFNAELYTYLPNPQYEAPYVAQRIPSEDYVFALTNLVVRFSEPVTNVEASDLLINGQPASSLVNSNDTIFTFAFPEPPLGPSAIVWATNHGITDLDAARMPFSGGTYDYILLNANAPRIVSVTPAEGSVVEQLTEVAVTFSESVTGVDAWDLLVSGQPAAQVVGSGADYVFYFTQPWFGTVNFTWTPDHGIMDEDTTPTVFDPSWPHNTWSYSLVDITPPVLTSQNPIRDRTYLRLTQITVFFSESVIGVNADDLLLNGKPATGITTNNGNIYIFTFPQPNGTNVNVTWAANHGITDLVTPANPFNATAPSATWRYGIPDAVAPSIASVSPAASNTVGVLTQIAVTFDEAVTNVSADKFTVNGTPALTVSGTGAGPYVFAFEQPPTGTVQVALSNGIFDLAPAHNQFIGASWSYTLDTNTPPPTVTRGPYLQIQTTTSMMIRWRTQGSTDSRVYYGPNPDSLTNFMDDATVTTEHIVNVTNLTPDSLYYYAVGATGTQPLRSTNYFFYTAPPVGTVRPYRIWYVSDFGNANANERAVRESYFNYVASEKRADIWITGGDNDQRNGQDSQYNDSFFGTNYAYGAMLVNHPVWTTIGNHDYMASQGTPYYANFSLPTRGEAGGLASGSESYYSYNYGNIHFVVMDGIDGTKSSGTNTTMIQWLRADLAANTQPWVIAYWHGPPYTKGSHDSDQASDTTAWQVQMRENVVPVLEQYGVDLVMCGHSHVHERTWLIQGHYGYSSTFSETNKVNGGDGKPSGAGAYRQINGVGTVYVSNGMGAEPRSTTTAKHPAHYIKVTDIPGSIVIDVNGGQLDFIFMNQTGGTEDSFSLIKSLGSAPRLVITRNNGVITLAWPKSEGNFDLLRSDNLGQGGSVAPGNWNPITSGILTNDALQWFQFNPATNGPAGFFQLRQK